MIRGNRRIPLL